MADLGDIRQRLTKRFRDVEKKVSSPSLPDLVHDKVERTVLAFLTELGVDYPIDFIVPPPDVYVPARQATIFLDPKGTTVGSPPIPSDQRCFTFKARDGGFYIIDDMDIIMEDPIAEEFFKITYDFDGQKNTAAFQCDQSTKEPGHWKFNRVVLADGDCLSICVENTNELAGGVFSLESRMWSL